MAVCQGVLAASRREAPGSRRGLVGLRGRVGEAAAAAHLVRDATVAVVVVAVVAVVAAPAAMQAVLQAMDQLQHPLLVGLRALRGLPHSSKVVGAAGAAAAEVEGGRVAAAVGVDQASLLRRQSMCPRARHRSSRLLHPELVCVGQR